MLNAETKSGRSLDTPAENPEVWTCGCTLVGGVSQVNAQCLACGNVFKKVGSKSKMSGHKKAKIENIKKIELVSTTQAMFPAEDALPCERCNDTGEIKVYTQEWDMIKSHMAPCPVCCSQEWMDWSAGKRLVKEK